MTITGEQLDKFIALYQSEFGVELTREEAYESASHLVHLVKGLAGGEIAKQAVYSQKE
jgi:predicted enzyme related to lactoylglutathione lyase